MGQIAQGNITQAPHLDLCQKGNLIKKENVLRRIQTIEWDELSN